jgi:ribosomal protein L19
MVYFSLKTVDNNISLLRKGIVERRNRKAVFGRFFFFKVGDVLEVFFFKSSYVYIFEGICLSIRKKYFVVPDVSIILCNVVQNVFIKCVFSYYYNRIYSLLIKDYKRKLRIYSKSKLFFLLRTKTSFRFV